MNQRPIVIVEIHHPIAAEKIRVWLAEVRYTAEWQIPKEEFPCSLIAWPIERTPPAMAKLKADK